MHRPNFINSHTLDLKKIGGIVFDKDGILIDSEPFLIRNILDAAKTYLKLEQLPDLLLTQMQKSFGQTHLKVARDFYGIIQNTGFEIKEPEHLWPDVFTDICRTNWAEQAKLGKVKKKNGVDKLFAHIRNQKIPTAMYTGTVRPMADVDIEIILAAKDLFKDPFIVTSDDPRVTNLEKSDPRGWELMANALGEHHEIAVSDIIAFEDRASGALGALRAGLKQVIVVPDPNDAPHDVDPYKFENYWDKKGLIKEHLQNHPDDQEKLVFLHSLENLTFA